MLCLTQVPRPQFPHCQNKDVTQPPGRPEDDRVQGKQGLPSTQHCSHPHSFPAGSGPPGTSVSKVEGSDVWRAMGPLLRLRPGPWHPRGCGWVPARGSEAPPAAEPAGQDCPPGRGDTASARAPRAPVSSPRSRVRRLALAGHRSGPPPATGPCAAVAFRPKEFSSGSC